MFTILRSSLALLLKRVGIDPMTNAYTSSRPMRRQNSIFWLCLTSTATSGRQGVIQHEYHALLLHLVTCL